MSQHDDDYGDWLHEVARDKLLDEAECEICVHYALKPAWDYDGWGDGQWFAVPYCKLGRDLKPCREFLREIGSEG